MNDTDGGTTSDISSANPWPIDFDRGITTGGTTILGNEFRRTRWTPHQAKIALPGGDWYRPGSDGFGRPNVRVQFITDDDQVVLLKYTGLVQATPAFRKAAETGGETRFEEQYMRMVMHFETGSERYTWLNQALFLAEGRIAGLNQIEYEIYRVA